MTSKTAPLARSAPAHQEASPETTYSISALAKEFGITTRTIRFYESRGLISPARVGTTRQYSKRDRARLILIFTRSQSRLHGRGCQRLPVAL